MARISYVSSYFMPLVCSGKTWVNITVLVNLVALYALAFGLSQLLISHYDDDTMFNPMGQDYFRTSLLGFFSPLALYFVRDFLLMASPRFVLFNLFVDFPLNDWLYLLMIFCLAYPQAQEAHAFNPLDDTLWHIIPKQSCIFGITWSLCELLLCLVENLHRYEEVPSPESAKRQLENQMMQEEQDLIRNNITLSKCIDVKQRASHISQNVYSSENNNNGSRAVDSNGAPSPEGVSADTVFVSFNDSSMSLLRDSEWGANSHYGLSDQRAGLCNGATIYFPEIVTARQFFSGLFALNVLVADSILLAVGHALIVSIYFIYVPDHDHLFTPAIIYFGSRSFGFFVLCIVMPLSIFSLISSVFLFLWKDEDPEAYSNAGRRTATSDLHIHTSRPQSVQYMTSDQLFVVNSIYTQDMSTSGDDNELRILRIFRAIMSTWRSLASHKSFPITGLTIWAVTAFVAGIITTTTTN